MTTALPPTQLTTTGSGTATDLGNQAEVCTAVTARAAGRGAATRDLTAQLTAVNPLLDVAGVRVESREFSLQDEHREGRLVGCIAQQNITLTVVRLEALEPLLRDLITAEAASVRGPRWQLADPGPTRRRAQHRAVADARDRAEGYAEALGVRLGELVSLTDGSGERPISARAAMAGSGGGDQLVDVEELQLDPEPVEIGVRCTVCWRISG